MNVCSSSSLIVVAFAVIAALAAPSASAEPVVVKPGKLVLPISGLEIELPKDKRKGFTWVLSSSYALSNEGRAFDGRDVLDEKIEGKLVAGTWVHVGYFDAGVCAETVKQAELTDAWEDERELFGARWALRGGVFTFEEGLGKVPAVVGCTSRPNQKALLFYRFFIDQPLTTTRDEALVHLESAAGIAQVTKSWLADRSAAVAPRKRPEVRSRGSVEAVRTQKLERSGLTVELPDDGFVWLVPKAGDEDVVDWMERMAPALPELDVEVLRVADDTCQEVFDAISAEKRFDTPPRSLPKGWGPGPTLVVDGKLERTMCRQVGAAALLVGVFVTPADAKGAADMKPIRPLLDALAKAAEATR